MPEPYLRKIRIYNRADNNLGIILTKSVQVPPWQTGLITQGTSVGSRIRQARVSAGLTINELARQSGLSSHCILEIEQEKRLPLITSLTKLVQTINISISNLPGYNALPEDTIAEKIKKHRLLMGMTQSQFAEFINVDFKTIRNWETGKSTPQRRIAERLMAMGLL